MKARRFRTPRNRHWRCKRKAPLKQLQQRHKISRNQSIYHARSSPNRRRKGLTWLRKLPGLVHTRQIFGNPSAFGPRTSPTPSLNRIYLSSLPSLIPVTSVTNQMNMKPILDDKESKAFTSVLKAAEDMIVGNRRLDEPLDLPNYDNIWKKMTNELQALQSEMEIRLGDLKVTEEQLMKKMIFKSQYLQYLKIFTPYVPSWDGSKRTKVLFRHPLYTHSTSSDCLTKIIVG